MSSHARLPHCGAEFSGQGAEFSSCMGLSSPTDGAEFSGWWGRVLRGPSPPRGWLLRGRLLRGADFSGRRFLLWVALTQNALSCTWASIARTLHQPNYPNQLAPKRGSQSSLILDPNLRWWANGVISLLFRPATFSAGGLISSLFSPAFDRTFDHLQLTGATLIFKMQKDL